MLFTGQDYLGAKGVWVRLGQRLTIPDQYISEIGYKVWRVGSPTGDVTFGIQNATSGEILMSEVWGDASQLPRWPEDSGNLTKVILDKPIGINGDVRLYVEFHGGNQTDYCVAGYWSGDRVTGEWYTNYFSYCTDVACWHDIGETEEGSYYYAWVDSADVKGDVIGGLPTWAIAPIGIVICGACVYISRKRLKKSV